MRRRTALALLVIIAGCSPAPDPPPSEGTWVGTITTEGNVTTVANESGSVWGGTATLVEEVSIGVEAGPQEYLFGDIQSIWDDGDRIIVAEREPRIVRVYDHSGQYLGDVGRSGEGPGEYFVPFSVSAFSDGRVLVTSAPSGWVDVYGPDLQYIERWGPFSHPARAPGARFLYAVIMSQDDTPYMRYRQADREGLPSSVDGYRHGWRAVGSEGPGLTIWDVGTGFEPWRSCIECRNSGSVTYSPSEIVWFLPAVKVISGISDRYRFEMRGYDGAAIAVEKFWDPVTVDAEERDYWMRWERAIGLMRDSTWRRSGPEVPESKPAFRAFLGTRNGSVVVERLGPSRRVEPCTDPPRPDEPNSVACWASSRVWDVFDADGRFLGAADPPPDRRRLPQPHIDGDRVTVVVEDEAGTIMVKRYRLVLPGEE